MNRCAGLAAFTAMLLFVSVGAEAQKMYRWVDDSGRVHYGDRPPPGKRQEVRKAQTPPAGNEAASGVTPACAELNERLATYRSATELVEQDALGNERSYSADEREQLITRTAAARDEACAPG